VWHSAEYPKGFNLIGYSHPDVDELLIQGRETTKKADRKVIYSQLFKSIAADAPYIFLYYPDAVQGINRRVRGLSKPSPVGLMNEIEKVYVVD
jgi:peptide/nickel transport system substrate-binding protein